MENLTLNEMARNLIANYLMRNEEQVMQEIILSTLKKYPKGLKEKALFRKVKKSLKKYKKVIDLLESI